MIVIKGQISNYYYKQSKSMDLGVEAEFNHLQGDRPFFFLECILTVYLLISQGVMSDKFLMPSLENISERYGFNKSIAGLLIAVGISIPELVITIISFQKHGTKMTEFGLATVFGSIPFVIAFVPAVSYFAIFGVRNPRPALTLREIKQTENLLPVFLRDVGFLIIGLLTFHFIMEFPSINFTQALGFLSLFVLYAVISGMMQHQRNQRNQKDEEEASQAQNQFPQSTAINFDQKQDALEITPSTKSSVAVKRGQSAQQEDLEQEVNDAEEHANESNALIDDRVEQQDTEQPAPKHYQNHEEPILKIIESFCFLVIKPMEYIMPVSALPELALVLIFVIVYIMCEFILTVFNVFSVYSGLGHFLVGLTLMVWGSDNLELVNMGIAMKNQDMEVGLTALLACQVICLILIVPIACLMRMYSHNMYEIQIMQTEHNRNAVVLPPLVVAACTLCIFWYRKMDLNRTSAALLLLIYLTYLSFNIYMFWNDAE